METRLQRVLKNRWVAVIASLAICYIALRTLVLVAEDAYYVYYVYPKGKGAEYSYPELRYTFGQITIFLWSLVGMCAAALTGRSAFGRTEYKWAARSIMSFVFGFVLLVFGFIAGMLMRGHLGL